MAYKRALLWKQKEASRLVRAAQAAGLVVEKIKVEPTGKISVLTAGNGNQAPPEINEWDRDFDGKAPVPVRS